MKTNDLDALARKVMQSDKFQLILKKETMRLYNILKHQLVLYYESYEPKINKRTGKPWYVRTYRFLNSLRVENIKQVGNALETKVLFDKNSVTRNNGRDYLPDRLNYGYDDKTGIRYHYDYYGGFHFMEKAKAEFDKNNKYNIKVVINRS